MRHRIELANQFRVAPFMPMKIQYHWAFSGAGDRLVVQMQNSRGGARRCDATPALRQKPATLHAAPA